MTPNTAPTEALPPTPAPEYLGYDADEGKIYAHWPRELEAYGLACFEAGRTIRAGDAAADGVEAEALRLAEKLKSICRRRDDIRCGLLTASACERIEGEREALIDRLAALVQPPEAPAENNVASVNGMPMCAHPNERASIGPTTSQINHFCPDCKQSWVTFPAPAAVALATMASTPAPQVPSEPPPLFKRMIAGYFAEVEAERAIEKILGLEWDTIAGIGFDYYDNSFEIYAPEEIEDIATTPEQVAAIRALGCDRFWINFKDGTERYCGGERKPSAVGRWRQWDAGDRTERRRVLAAAASGSIQVPSEAARLVGGEAAFEKAYPKACRESYTYHLDFKTGWDAALAATQAAPTDAPGEQP